MNQKIDLLHGKILPSLTGLALPIMATSLVQTAYNLTDMAWIGRVGSDALAAVGTAGMYTWLSSGIVMMARMGGQVRVAHCLGDDQKEEAAHYAAGALQMTILLAFLFSMVTVMCSGPLLDFFHLDDPWIVNQAKHYLQITCGLILFAFLNQTLTGLFTALGDSRTPFFANAVGLAVNMILDPLLIFGIGPFPVLGVTGAAAATVIAQMIVTLVLFIGTRRDSVLFRHVQIFSRIRTDIAASIIRIGFPSAVQNTLYCGISMFLTRLVAGWGASSVAIQRVGGQVECISWMTAEGFGSAMNAFTGQNFGAKNYARVKHSYLTALVIIVIWGLFTTSVLVFGAEPIFRIFVQEPMVVPGGVQYLRILGYAQMFMCVELMTVGAMQGLGRTFECSGISISLTALRIPLALVLQQTALGLNGIWWALTISSMLKGVVFFGAYLRMLGKLQLREERK